MAAEIKEGVIPILKLMDVATITGLFHLRLKSFDVFYGDDFVFCAVKNDGGRTV